MTRTVREGVLVTYRGAVPLGRESFRDDGDVLTSDIVLLGKQATITIRRSLRTVEVSVDGKSSEHALGPKTVALENGHWQAYAAVAEAFADAKEPARASVLLPAQGLTLEGTVTVTPGTGGARTVRVELQGLAVIAEVDANGVVRRAKVPAQGLEVLPEGETPERTQSAPAPANVSVEALEVTSRGVAIRGEAWWPKSSAGKVPVVLLIAGSGPTDRDGNNAMGLRTDTYRQLAEALASQGIATVRFDKRGVGRSGVTFEPAKTTLDDFVADTLALADKVRSDARAGKVAYAGHSEGGLIALLAAAKKAPDALVLLAAAGRPMGVLVREQLATKLDAKLLAETDRILAALRAGRSPDPVPEALAPLFHPNVRVFLRSVIDVDPAALLKKLPVKTAIVQGEHDAQVRRLDAELLAKAKPDAVLTLLPTANHVFKAEASASLPQASYSDPGKPLDPKLVRAVVAAVR